MAASHRLEPTYEGLKLEGASPRGDFLLRLEPTYEGLKPVEWAEGPRRIPKFGAYL